MERMDPAGNILVRTHDCNTLKNHQPFKKLPALKILAGATSAPRFGQSSDSMWNRDRLCTRDGGSSFFWRLLEENPTIVARHLPSPPPLPHLPPLPWPSLVTRISAVSVLTEAELIARLMGETNRAPVGQVLSSRSLQKNLGRKNIYHTNRSEGNENPYNFEGRE